MIVSALATDTHEENDGNRSHTAVRIQIAHEEYNSLNIYTNFLDKIYCLLYSVFVDKLVKNVLFGEGMTIQAETMINDLYRDMYVTNVDWFLYHLGVSLMKIIYSIFNMEDKF